MDLAKNRKHTLLYNYIHTASPQNKHSHSPSPSPSPPLPDRPLSSGERRETGGKGGSGGDPQEHLLCSWLTQFRQTPDCVGFTWTGVLRHSYRRALAQGRRSGGEQQGPGKEREIKQHKKTGLLQLRKVCSKKTARKGWCWRVCVNGGSPPGGARQTADCSLLAPTRHILIHLQRDSHRCATLQTPPPPPHCLPLFTSHHLTYLCLYISLYFHH